MQIRGGRMRLPSCQRLLQPLRIVGPLHVRTFWPPCLPHEPSPEEARHGGANGRSASCHTGGQDVLARLLRGRGCLGIPNNLGGIR
jgi:hypothetical protein